MPRHKKGTIVRAYTEEELGAEEWDANDGGKHIHPHGYIWIVQRWIPVTHPENEYNYDAYECRSVATGAVKQLFPKEITTKLHKEQTND